MTRTIWLTQPVRPDLTTDATSPILTYPTDYEILRDGLKLARRLGQADPLSNSLVIETSPGPSVQTDEQWVDWLRGSTSSEFHPSSSCSMLAREQGGVVDAQLFVYGLANVRVADASVPPIALSTHLMASTYGLAEQASNIIRASYSSNNSTGGGSSNTGGGSSSTGGSSQNNAKSSNNSNSMKGASVLYSIYPFLLLLYLSIAQ